MLLESKASLQSQQASLTLLIRGSMGVQLHAKGSDEAGRAKLTQKKFALAVDLKMELGEMDYRVGVRVRVEGVGWG